MILRNFSPFVPLIVPFRDRESRDFWSVGLKGTFLIQPGLEASIAPEQAPIFEFPVYHGEDYTSSVRVDADTAPPKPRCDICLSGTARPPMGRATSQWDAELRVGLIGRTLRVTGPRSWVRRGGAYVLTDPDLVVEVPLRYELAFGGVWRDNWGQSDVFQENPVGLGYVKEGHEPTAETIPAPQIEHPDDPISEIGCYHRPQGFGPIPPSWLPRRSLAGTYDERWQCERWPELPMDFDEAFHNCAHPDLIYPGYPQGGEEVYLEGIGAGPLRFFLPAWNVRVYDRPAFSAPDPVIDTVFIDVDDGIVQVMWKTAFPEAADVDVIEIHARKM